ncbi:MAG: molybdenum cofactor guanylyltransferase [Acidilobaceae archaeon]|nr:molybdenum cofactor guanylyltransferase [Acidilobaceae archaeon]
MACGIVLSGGLSRRFQVAGEPWRDKALYELGGKPMISYALEKLEKLAEELLIAAGTAERAELYGRLLGVRAVADDQGLSGPLAGLYASLRLCREELFLALPNDMPFLPQALLEEMLSRAEAYDVVSPAFPNGLVETTVVAGRVRSALWVLGLLRGMGRSKVADLHRGAPRVYLVSPVGKHEARAFLNVNARESLREEPQYPEGPLRGDVSIERSFGEEEARAGRAPASLWATLFKGAYVEEFLLYASKGLYMFAAYALQDSHNAYERELGKLVARALKPPL